LKKTNANEPLSLCAVVDDIIESFFDFGRCLSFTKVTWFTPHKLETLEATILKIRTGGNLKGISDSSILPTHFYMCWNTFEAPLTTLHPIQTQF
jgi:hypothetical protein